MFLTEREIDKLLIFSAGELARKRRERGLKLNYPEAAALITSEVLEGIRDGQTVSALMEMGRQVLGRADVLDGVPEMLAEIQIEGTFPDGTKLVTIHDPIRAQDNAVPGLAPRSQAHVPGEYLLDEGEIELNAGRPTVRLRVDNTGDRPIQIGSHVHFFEVNAALRFDRPQAYGFRLNVPAGTAVRFEPGEGTEVELVALGGERRAYGMNALVMGSLDASREAAIAKARQQGFIPPEARP